MAFFKNSDSPVPAVGQKSDDPHKRNAKMQILCSCEGCNQLADCFFGSDLCTFHFAVQRASERKAMTEELHRYEELVALGFLFEKERHHDNAAKWVFDAFCKRARELGVNYAFDQIEGRWIRREVPLPTWRRDLEHASQFIKPIYWLTDVLANHAARMGAFEDLDKERMRADEALSNLDWAKYAVSKIARRFSRHKPVSAPLEEVPL